MDLKRNKVYYLSAAGAYKWKEESRAGDRFELHLGRYDDFVHLIWYPQRQDGRGVPSGDGGGQQRCPIDACTVGSHVPLERFDAHRGKGRTYRHHQQNPESHHQVDFPGDGSQKPGGKSHIHGLHAMKEMQRHNPEKQRATNWMVLFVVLNTASIQLIPTTIAVIRGKYGAQSPMDILPAVWVTSLTGLVVGIFVAKLLQRKK